MAFKKDGLRYAQLPKPEGSEVLALEPQAVSSVPLSAMTTASTKNSRYAQLNAAGRLAVQNIGEARAASRTVRSALVVDRSGGCLVLSANGWNKDVSHWLLHGELCDAMVDALEAWSPGRKSNTLETRVGELDRGFFQFVRITDPLRVLRLVDIDTKWVSLFIGWLDRKDDNHVPVWSPQSRSSHLLVFRVLINALKKSSAWAMRLADKLLIPQNPWPGRTRQMKPREMLDDHTLVKLLLACRDEAVETIRRVRGAWASMERMASDPPSGRPRSPEEWLYLYGARYTDFLPNSDWLSENDPDMWLAYRQMGLTCAEIRAPLVPRGRDFVPFVILLAFPTSYNADTVRQLLLSDIEKVDGFGGERIRLVPYKGRASRTQPRSFAVGDELGPDGIVVFVEEWTRRLRKVAAPEFKDTLFLMSAAGKRGSDRAMVQVSNYKSGGVRASAVWYKSLESFLKDHDLPSMALAQMRPTSLDAVHELTGGDLKAVQTAGGQRRPQVIFDHYTSDGARKRNDEALAALMQTRERVVAKKGAVADPRKEPHGSDRGCATPGFMCLDPFSSPWPGEVEGRMCQAFGMCPCCPLACVNPQDPYAAARVLQLRAAVNAAQSEVGARRWLECWAPVGKRLDDYWLPLFSEESVLSAAAALTLPPLPSLE